MRVSSINNHQMSSYAQPAFKAQMSKKDIRIAIDSMETIENYNPYEMLPKLQTVLEYAAICPGDKLKFVRHTDSNTEEDFYTLNLDGENLVHSDSLDGAWALLFRSYIESDAGITTHARMPKTIFDQKWFSKLHSCPEYNEKAIYELAYDA